MRECTRMPAGNLVIALGMKKKRNNWRRADPFVAREVQKYGTPAPSREFLLEYLDERGMPMTESELCQELGCDENESEAVARRLRAMARDGQLIRNRRDGFGVARRMDLIAGRVIGHPEGYGFVVPDEGGDDLFLSAREMRSVLHADRVLVRVAGVDRRGRREAALAEVLERKTESVVGRYFDRHGSGHVVADNRRIAQDIDIPPGYDNGARDGQIVQVDIVEQPTRRNRPVGRVVEVIGDHMAPGMEVEIAIRAHGIPVEWPQSVLEEIRDFGDSVPNSAEEGRVDLRDLPLVTIDGVTARDFDDAVYCERRGRNWRVIVAIADVSHYVQMGTALDREAELRGNSVYFPDRVVPMLPEVLSNGLCSLNPDVDRLCLACDMTVDSDGKLVRSRFVEGVMRSHARLTYDAVGAAIQDRDDRVRAELGELVAHLDRLYQLYQVLRDARERRGAMDFESQESVIEYGADGKIENIRPTERNDAHKLIEECMIAANVASARFLRRHKIPCLFRVHEGPSAAKLESLRVFLGELGLGLAGGDKPTPQDFAALLERVEERPDKHLIQTVLLKSLARAVYTPGDQGHFGLALPAYTHFTSPIRRYPDLLVHRAIRHVLRGGKAADFRYGVSNMEALGEQCSMTERRADEAVWDTIEWLKCEYMEDRVGEVFEGIVSSVVGFGLFVELKDVFVEGLVHITSLENDYYHFDPVGHRLTGERSGRVFRLGDPIRVRVVRVDLDDRKIDFEPVGQAQAKERRGRRGKRRR